MIPRVLGLLIGRPVADGGRVRVLLKGAPEQMTALYSSYAQGDADPKPMDEACAVHPPAPVPPGCCMHPLFRPAAVCISPSRAREGELRSDATRAARLLRRCSLSLSLLQHVRSELEASTMRMGEQGLRCIAVAYRDIDIDAFDASVSHLPLSEQGTVEHHSHGSKTKTTAMASDSALTHTRHHTRRVPGVPGSTKRRRCFNRGHGMPRSALGPYFTMAARAHDCVISKHRMRNERSQQY